MGIVANQVVLQSNASMIKMVGGELSLDFCGDRLLLNNPESILSSSRWPLDPAYVPFRSNIKERSRSTDALIVPHNYSFSTRANNCRGYAHIYAFYD